MRKKNPVPAHLTPSEEDEQLLAADLLSWYAKRDDKALARILARLRNGWLHTFAMLRNGEQEDLVADFIYRKLLTAQGTPLLPTDPQARLLPHIRKVVRNECIDAHRRWLRQVRKGVPTESQALEALADVGASVGWNVPMTHQVVEAREGLREVYRLLDRVVPLRRMALILRRELYTSGSFGLDMERHAGDLARERGETLEAVWARLQVAMGSTDPGDTIRVCYPRYRAGTPEAARIEEAFRKSASRGADDLDALQAPLGLRGA